MQVDGWTTAPELALSARRSHGVGAVSHPCLTTSCEHGLYIKGSICVCSPHDPRRNSPPHHWLRARLYR